MIIFAIDDETAILSELHHSIEEARPEADIHDFRFAGEALKAITESGIIPDIVFSDIANLYAFEIPEKDIKLLEKITEKYIVFQSEHRFSTLEFYHSVN